ncbi:DUF1840 domain-containing protein [Thiofilum flexile]|uniref:DUF1840 domain-containing protein n=1 Tax=Thiofilum flexile TaxID=125627 RepID=UPI0003748DFB|nr:DUF1840 domain-containing protein [Thiofilum flexile]
MLVKFTNTAGMSVSMYEKDAKPLIINMGTSGTVPSALRPEDLPQALASLQAALKAQEAAPASNDDEEDKGVNPNARAYPLIELLKQSIKDNKAVMWEYSDGVL